jgi:hypothetical protein
MRLTVSPSHDHIRAARKQAYLQAWPIEAQLEAHAEAAAGRPDKLTKMLADLAEIRSANPIPGGANAV